GGGGVSVAAPKARREGRGRGVGGLGRGPRARGGPRLPPGELCAGASRGLLGLDGAERAPWGAWFRARARVGDLGGAAAEVAARLAGGGPGSPALLRGLRIVGVETTGLAGGTGTLPFLARVGRLAGEAVP